MSPYPRLNDPENNRIISLLKNLNHIHVPLEILDLRDPDALHVYCVYVRIARGLGGCDVELPKVDDLAAICGMTRRRLYKAEKCLRDSGWITVRRIQLPGQGETRRHAIVKYDNMVITTERAIAELIDSVKSALSGDLHNMYTHVPPTDVPAQQELEPEFQFPQHIKNLIRSTSLRDEQGRPLSFAGLSDFQIHKLTHFAELNDVAAGLIKLGMQKKPVRSIHNLFRGMFTLTAEGKGTLKGKFRAGLEPTPMPGYKKNHDLPLVVVDEQTRSLERLARGEWVEHGTLQLERLKFLRKANALEMQDVQVRLLPGCTIIFRNGEPIFKRDAQPQPVDQLVGDLAKDLAA